MSPDFVGQGVLRPTGRWKGTNMSPMVRDPAEESAARGFSVTCPAPVARPVMVQRWNDVVFVNWRVAPDDVQRLLPHGEIGRAHV